MAIQSLEFYNKNQFRRFPFKMGTTLTSSEGFKLTDDLIVGLSLTTTYGKHNLYVNQIYAKAGFISVNISTNSGSVLGRFAGTLSQNFTTLAFESFQKFASGFITFGSYEAIATIEGGHIFEFAATELEESSIHCYTPPAVTSLVKRDQILTGDVEFGLLTNLTRTLDGNTVDFKVSSTIGITSLADKASIFGNCDTPIITSINGALPYPAEDPTDLNDGNVYLIGVKPIVFYGEEGEGSIVTTTVDVDLDKLCTARNKVLPPVNPTYLADSLNGLIGKESYYTKSQTPPVNFTGTVYPEFLSWPQFLPTVSRVIEEPEVGTESVVTFTGLEGSVAKVLIKLLGSGSVTVTLKKEITPLEPVVDIEVDNNYAELYLLTPASTFEAGDTYNIEFTAVTGTPTIQVILFYTTT